MTTSLRLLLVDDDVEFVRHFEILGEGVFDLNAAASAHEALEAMRAERPDAVLLDVDLGGGADGIDLLARIRREDPEIPVVMVSGDEAPHTVVRAMRAGADDYVSKSPNLELLRLKIRKALDATAWKSHARRMQSSAAGDLIGSSRAMRDLRDEIARLAPRNVRVLVRGETGTGKELVAAALHAGSSRRDGRFVVVAGAVGSDELFDSDLFGHERGSFTGAERRRLGKFELASGGTLFLDEIDRLNPARQGKLLRVVESRRFERLGGSEDLAADVRLVSATNADLEAAIGEGAFLSDLYYRIAEYELHVPPLRARTDDVPELAAFLLGRFARSEGVATPILTSDAFDPLVEHPWPGNVRELDAVLKRAAILARSDRIGTDDVVAALRNSPGRTPADVDAANARLSDFLDGDYAGSRDRLDRAFDRLAIEDALRRTGGNVSGAARKLGLSRATLHRRIADLGIETRTTDDPVD